LEGGSQIQPWTDSLNSSHCRKGRKSTWQIYQFYGEKYMSRQHDVQNDHWSPLSISSCGLLMTPSCRKTGTLMKHECLINNLLAKKKWGLYLYLVRLYLPPLVVCLTRPELWTMVSQSPELFSHQFCSPSNGCYL
jgi:hypothetical protein